jgi:hypothetical protein
MGDQPIPPRAHSEIAHQHLGFCAWCRGYSWAAEANGWRTYAAQGRLGRLLYRWTRPKELGPTRR